MISRIDAEVVAAKSIEAYLSAPTNHGWKPHFLKEGDIAPDTEWSTVDTALGFASALLAAQALELVEPKEQLRKALDELDFDAVTNSLRVSMGFHYNRELKNEDFWTDWGGETKLVELMRAYQNPDLPTMSCDRNPPAFAGRGFIYEIGGLLFPQLAMPGYGPDIWGVDWHQVRLAHYSDQRQVRSGQEFLGGLSSFEVINEYGETNYLAAGIGDESNPLIDSLEEFGGPWVGPHYLAMTASLNPDTIDADIQKMIDKGAMPPLSGPAESILLDDNGNIIRWHSAQISLNAFFNVLGYYHAIIARDGGVDAVYNAALTDDGMVQAFNALSKYIVVLEGEDADGDGAVRSRSNASQQESRYLQSGESVSWNIDTPSSVLYDLTVRYSNDNLNEQPGEAISVYLDGFLLTNFSAQDTGDGGAGWNVFLVEEILPSLSLSHSNHTVTLQVEGGDGYGVEIDSIGLIAR